MKKGFTFIEILVVITIIGLVTLGAVVTYINIAKKSRDAKRKQDLEKLRFALEDYRLENLIYPAAPVAVNSSNWGAVGTALISYFPNGLPVDPKNSGYHFYYYKTSLDNKDYELNALLEIDRAGENDGGNNIAVYELGTDLSLNPYGGPAVSPSPSAIVFPSPSPLLSPSPYPICPYSCCPTGVTTCKGTLRPEYSCGEKITSFCCQGTCWPVGPCFTKGTEIILGNGEKRAIEEIKEGEEVLSFDKNLKIQKAKVIGVYKNISPSYLILTAENNLKVETTAEHPFFTEKMIFKKAKELGKGEGIYIFKNNHWQLVKIESIRKITKEIEVYNLTVDTFATFFANDFAVHNKDPLPPPPPDF
ncbi:MAG: polymorphic toxin-type HINT domain-containing protein [Candidatus Omnitrophica bacterium]|nr:polymorphic toxin-type HINT domain-containing protein [Candidatus Omnitrophota bacterium]